MSFKLSYESGTVAENDDIQEQIEIEGGSQYLQRSLYLVLNKSDVVVGEMTGYMLNVFEIYKEPSDSFFVMDGISQLLCNVHEYVIEHEHTFSLKKHVLYLNRLTLYEEHHNNNLESEILDFLTNKFEAVIYSFGSTELSDSGFSAYQNSYYIKYWEKELIKKGWFYNNTFDFYIKSK